MPVHYFEESAVSHLKLNIIIISKMSVIFQEQAVWMLFSNLCKPFTISPVLLLLPNPPMRKIFSCLLVCNTTAAWTDLSWLKRDWEETRLSDLTSMLRSESNHLAHCAKRCKKSDWWTLRMRPSVDRCRRQRGCGQFSLGRRIKGWAGWEVTWFRKRRDGAVGNGWERFNAC